ncbi:MAG: hypothetical protein WC686_05110 [Candidatus Shapirobacteria bacterium]|jgi:hypothetical protein
MNATLPTDPLRFRNIGDVVTALLKYVYVFAGLALLLVLISGGILLMTAGGDPNKSKEGYGKIKSGLIGFLIIFCSYFLAQIAEKILGISILK